MSGTQAPSAAARHAMETLDLTVKGATAYERDDLVTRLAGARRLLSDPSVTVHVVGEFKQGKSSLINALLTAPICPVDDDIATAVPTEVRYGDRLTATAGFEPASGSNGAGWTEAVDPAAIAAYVSEAGNADNHRRLRSLTVGIDRPLLSTGLVLVDTPGVGGLGSATQARALATLPQSHAVLFVSDASGELTDTELQTLRAVRDLCPEVALVVTKTDLYPHWQRIVDRDRAHLERHAVPADVLAVSSEVRTLAARDLDQDMNNESGFPVLVKRVNDVLGRSHRIALDAVVTHVLSAVDQMETTARARRTALADPEGAAALVTALAAAKERADALRERSSKWQVVLQDGFSDIASDIDFDLRGRSRTVLHEAEAAIDEGDPAKNWAGFEEWLRQRLAGEALENYALFVRRAKEVAAAVGEHFELAENEIVTAREVSAPVGMIDDVVVDSAFAEKKARGAGMAAFQKAYGGFLMFTMLTHMAALAIPAPVGLLAGVLMGRSGLREERKRQLDRRRGEAKATVRRFVDEFNLQIGKDSRDAVRHVQRELRGAWSDRVGELQRTAAAGLAAAQEAARGGEDEASRRARLDADLESLAMLRARVDDLRAHLARQVPATSDADDPVGTAS